VWHSVDGPPVTRNCQPGALPGDAGSRRRYCDTTCRSRHWRPVQRHDEIHRRVMASLNQELERGRMVWGQGRCPACGLTVAGNAAGRPLR